MSLPPKSFKEIAAEAREQSGVTIDYPTLLLWEVSACLGFPPGSPERQGALGDLETLLSPVLDEEYLRERNALRALVNRLHANGQRQDESDREYRKRRDPKLPTAPEEVLFENYHERWFRLLVIQAKRAGLLPMGRI